MTLRTGHGTGAGQPRIEVSPVDELPAGIPDDTRTTRATDRGAHGRFAPGNKLARIAGRSKAGHTRLARRLGLTDLAADPAFTAYRRSAAAFRRAHCASIARDVGGGVCGPAPSSIVASAALQLAASRFLFDKGDPDFFQLASKLANDSRQNLLAAHELAAREAKARVDLEGDGLTQAQRDFQRRLAESNQDASAGPGTAADPSAAAGASDVNVEPKRQAVSQGQGAP